MALQDSVDQYIARYGEAKIFAYIRKETSSLPEELRHGVKTLLRQFNAMP